jgi:two-component system nitrate/nitrite response regulator NarL
VSPIRVVIADDHPPTRAGVRSILEGANFEVVAEASDATGAVAAAVREKPDVCLLDIHMPGNGISAAMRITTEAPDAAVVMLTVSRNDEDLFDALRAGAVGYLLKDTDPDRLGPALEGVLAGEAALPRTLVARLVGEFQARTRRRLPLAKKCSAARLTSREWQVLELMRDGLTTMEMADRMFVSAVTVRTHVSSILKKLQVPDRDAAVRLMD